LDVPADVDWFELDRQEILTGKDVALADFEPRCRRHIVAGDVAGEWLTPLLDAGFDRSGQTLWLAEGLFFYLTEQIIVEMLRGAAHVCGTGSLVAADVIGKAGLDSPAMQPYRDWCERNGVPPPFGSDDPVGLFEAGGWQLDHVTAPGASDANYGRLPIGPDGVIPGRPHLVVGRLSAGR
jgi:methyltransferase (TIGR00027 family)